MPAPCSARGKQAAYVAEAIGKQPIFDDRIREVGNSYNNGQPIDADDLPRAYNRGLRPSPFDVTVTDVDNAETWMHFRIRIGQFVDDLYRQYSTNTVYVVAHGGVMAALFDLVFNVGVYRNSGVDTYNTGISRFAYHPGKSFTDWTLKEHNKVEHLVQAGLL